MTSIITKELIINYSDLIIRILPFPAPEIAYTAERAIQLKSEFIDQAFEAYYEQYPIYSSPNHGPEWDAFRQVLSD